MPKPTSKKISYKDAGVDIENADTVKREMAESLKTKNSLVLNSFGAFASVLDGSFSDYDHPVLVCKTEEPGSKQLLAFQHGRIESICQDLVHHLIDDIIVMGAHPLFVQDLIVCGKLDGAVVKRIVAGISAACTEQGCVLTGGETSEQPGVLAAGTYVLGASGIGIAEKSNIIDGSAIQAGDTVLAIASNGPHTNGYTLIRTLLANDPALAKRMVGGQTFLDAAMQPHTCYYKPMKDLFENKGLHGMAHITGGGIPGNLNRILPKNMDASINADAIKILPVFQTIHDTANNDDADMIKTYNLGVGLAVVVSPDAAGEIAKHVRSQGVECYEIGKIIAGGGGVVRMQGELKWKT